ncbi:hypothetical protein QJS65_02990 [Bacillus altitudinis]|uniref:hypothetical protein n=1 Tax=Bacillus altitudinis TaxID=293387 RepID=UPI0024A935D7|nr:hypothetical protein [Bacillus altitudinis]WHF27638.1 hypothetical protein QJS65_02990 [Bacillus altitudinis]
MTDTNDNEQNIIWKEYENENGGIYRVGYVEDEPLDDETQNRVSNKKSFSISVNWPVKNSTVQKTSNEVKQTAAITEYALYDHNPYHSPRKIFKYRLIITNTEHYDYYFKDESGDNYELNTFWNRTHYLEYNSEAPNIIRIEGS